MGIFDTFLHYIGYGIGILLGLGSISLVLYLLYRGSRYVFHRYY